MSEALSDTGLSAAQSPPAEAPLTRQLRALQIRLSADAIRNTALSAPVWALVLSVLFGGAVPQLGRGSLTRALPWVALCLFVALGLSLYSRIVAARAKKHALDERFWIPLTAFGYFALAAAWCISTPLFWIPGNTLNHCFLLVITIASASLFLTCRGGKFSMVTAATLPNFVMTWFEFLHRDTWFNSVMIILLPVWVVQLHMDSWRACRTVTAAHRTKLEMEALAVELAEARDEASAANRAKSLFLANMSHELRTPLNAIIGFSDMIANDALGPLAQAKYRDYAGDILRSGRHLLGLINDILDLAKIEAGKLELDRKWVDGTDVLGDCTKLFAETAQKNGVTLRLSATDHFRVFVDERALRQIVLNLLSNAVKFTPPGGMIETSLAAAGTGAVISVRDTGCGIPADQLTRIFQPFEQADNRYGRATGGTGLGLTLVRALCELHGGHCRIESEVGKGTLVSVFLPRVETPGLPEIASPVSSETRAA